MTWTAHDIPDLTGRIAVVTGANGGLGLASATELARHGAHVVMAARDASKAEAARDAILAAVPEASLEPVPLDLASQRSAAGAAATILERHRAVDILLLNAGVMAVPEGRTEDGFETQLAVNHLGHWTLAAGLLPAVLAADAARVVTVTSIARHSGAPLDPGNPHLEGVYDDWRAYGQSKRANLLFALGLDTRLREAGSAARALVAHPGITHSDLQKRTVREGGGGAQGRFWEAYAERRGMTIARGALPQLRAATDAGARGGTLYGPRWGLTGDPVRLPLWSRLLRRGRIEREVDRLWDTSGRLTGVAIDVGGAGRTA